MNMKSLFKSTPIDELESQKSGVEGRIKKLESDLRAPLEQDLSDQAPQLANRALLSSLLKTERAILMQIKQALELRRH